jgi:HEAT repeat protein
MNTVAPDPVGTEILSKLQSPDPYEQYFAVLSICDLERSELLPALVPLLESRFKDLRYVAVQAIGDYGSTDSKFYGPVLVPLLDSPDPEMRQYAAEALGSIDYQEAIPAIEKMIGEEADEETLRFTQRALRFLQRQATEEDQFPVFRAMSVNLLEYELENPEMVSMTVQ